MGLFNKVNNVASDIANIFSGKTYVETDKVIVKRDTPITVVQYNLTYIEELERRNQELLEHSNFQLTIIRAQKNELKDQRAIIGELDNLLVDHVEYRGSDLEKRAVLAGSDIRDV